MPTSQIAEDCGSKELNLQSEPQKKTSMQDKNFKKLQVSVKSTNDMDGEYMSPNINSAKVLLKPAENQNFGHFDYDHHQKHGQKPYCHSNGHVSEYAATYVPSQTKMDSYVDLRQCEKENRKNMQYGHQQANYAGHSNVQTVTGQEQYGNQTHNNTCRLDIESCVSKNYPQHMCRRTTKNSRSLWTCFVVTIIIMQFIFIGLFAWILIDKIDSKHHKGEHATPKKDDDSHQIDDTSEVTSAPEKYQNPIRYPTPAPPKTKGPLPATPTLGIKMEIDPSFLSSQASTVMWTYPDERHLTGIEYHNGYFRVNVTGFYFVQSTLSLDNRPNTGEEDKTIRFVHCIKVDGRPKMDICEKKDILPIKLGGSTVQDPMMYLESGSSVYVLVSHMTKIYDSATDNKFIMFLQRVA